MEIEVFIKQLEQEFENIPSETLKPETVLRTAIDWNSMNALILIASVNTEYDVILTGNELNAVQTVEDLFNLVKNKVNQ